MQQSQHTLSPLHPNIPLWPPNWSPSFYLCSSLPPAIYSQCSTSAILLKQKSDHAFLPLQPSGVSRILKWSQHSCPCYRSTWFNQVDPFKRRSRGQRPRKSKRQRCPQKQPCYGEGHVAGNSKLPLGAENDFRLKGNKKVGISVLQL